MAACTALCGIGLAAQGWFLDGFIPRIQLLSDSESPSFLSAASQVGLSRRPFAEPTLQDDAAIQSLVAEAHHDHSKCTRLSISFPYYATQWNGGVATFRAAVLQHLPSQLPCTTCTCPWASSHSSDLKTIVGSLSGPKHGACPLCHKRAHSGVWHQPWKPSGLIPGPIRNVTRPQAPQHPMATSVLAVLARHASGLCSTCCSSLWPEAHHTSIRSSSPIANEFHSNRL